MAIKIIRICDECGEDYEQFINENTSEVTYSVLFICSDCQLDEIRSQNDMYKCFLCSREIYAEVDSYDYCVTCKNGPQADGSCSSKGHQGADICTFCKEKIEKQNLEEDK